MPPEDPKRRPTWLRRTAIALGSVVAFYLVGANLFLNLKLLYLLINDEKSVVIHYTFAYSLLPGTATVHGFRLRGQDSNLEFELYLDVVHITFNPGELFKQRFHATRVTATGSTFKLRQKIAPSDLGSADVSALPPILGFSDPPIHPPPEGPSKPPDLNGLWTLHIEGVEAEAVEAWVDSVRYTGRAVASGSFWFSPMSLVEVDGRAKFLSGEATFHGRRVATGLHGDASCAVQRFDPMPVKGNDVFRFIDTSATLSGELQNATFINGALANNSVVPSLASSPGSFDLYVRLNRGKIAEGTRFNMRAAHWQLEKGNYRAGANYARIEALVRPEGAGARGTMTMALGPYQVAREEPTGTFVTGDGLVLTLDSSRLDVLDHPLADLGLSADIARAEMGDLSRLNAFLPKNPEAEILGGPARCRAGSRAQPWDPGRARSRSKGARRRCGSLGCASPAIGTSGSTWAG